MRLLAKIPHACVELHWDRALSGPAEMRASQLRGALARAFADDDLFHQHDNEGNVLYRYPRVQYRWYRGNGLVMGWQEAAHKLLQLPWLDLTLRLSNEPVSVTDAMLSTSHGIFAVSDRLQHYRLVSPALLFNQKNYQRYREKEEREQQVERDRLLVAQLLTAMRALQTNFPGHLYATFTYFHTRTCRYKQQELLGLTGRFVCNAVLPDGLAIGHAVSHGYGWIVPANSG
jgi:hypothetical protein